MEYVGKRWTALNRLKRAEITGLDRIFKRRFVSFKMSM
jgi:hypothetical protein